MKACIKCKVIKPLEDYHNNCGTADGKLSTCKPCRIYQQREYRNSGNRNKDNRYNRSEKRNNNLYAYWERNPEKKYAQSQLGNALRSGKIDKRKSCQCCDTEKVEGHHWSYEKEHVLDVFWLCKSCHTKEHEIIKVKGYPDDRKLYIEDKNSEL